MSEKNLVFPQTSDYEDAIALGKKSFKTLDLEFEMATHHIFNYQWVKRKRIFRVELYDKNYENLIKKNIGSLDKNIMEDQQ